MGETPPKKNLSVKLKGFNTITGQKNIPFNKSWPHVFFKSRINSRSTTFKSFSQGRLKKGLAISTRLENPPESPRGLCSSLFGGRGHQKKLVGNRSWGLNVDDEVGNLDFFTESKYWIPYWQCTLTFPSGFWCCSWEKKCNSHGCQGNLSCLLNLGTTKGAMVIIKPTSIWRKLFATGIHFWSVGLPSLKLTACTWKVMVGRWNFLLGWPIFRCYVSFSEGTVIIEVGFRSLTIELPIGNQRSISFKQPPSYHHPPRPLRETTRLPFLLQVLCAFFRTPSL